MFIAEKKVEKIDCKITREVNILKEIESENQLEELVELKAYGERFSMENVEHAGDFSSKYGYEITHKQELREKSDNGINLNNKWINKENKGVELEYQRDDGRKFHFEIEKDESDKINVHFINSNLNNRELSKLKLKTKYSFFQKAVL